MTKEKTMHELAKEFPTKNYRELERYRDADRNEEAQQIYVKQDNEELKEDQLTESQQKQEELEPIRHGLSTDAQKNEEIRELKDKINKLKKEIKELKHAKPGK